jgi:putative membrane-bound dehydrogenase-like protein
MPRRAFLPVIHVLLVQSAILLPRPATAQVPGTDALPAGFRLAYLEEHDPYYPCRESPRLITPRWVGEPGVEAVVVLAIDDMRDTARYEKYLRPILNRLKAIDGRAPVSIMTNQVDPRDPQLQAWLKEGLSLECHTLTHPCPLLQRGDLGKAARDYHACVDLMSKIPGNQPVAFRMPCCDSLNTVSPRFFAEIFNQKSQGGNALAIDSSVFTVLTPDDPSLPRELVYDADGRERFRKYIPFPSFVNTIENYPYPYPVGRVCWEFPCIVPSDWEGFNLQKAGNPRTLLDLKAALDAVVLKHGVFDLVFHPYGWIKPEQVVALIDHAVAKHGKKVKFLNFREAEERLRKNLLAGRPLRAESGGDNGVRFFDDDHDGIFEVKRNPQGAGRAAARVLPDDVLRAMPLPPGAEREDRDGRDAGLRLVDLDEDGHLDVVFSNDREYGIYLFDPAKKGWARKVMAGQAGQSGALPKIARGGASNGFFVHSRQLWWQNEDTATLPDLVDRRSFNDLLKDVEPRGKSPEAALKSMRVLAGFTIELAAAEPLVKDPIAFEWGADGKLWVVEMGDYPLGGDGKGKPAGVVRFLEDGDGDGHYDTQTTFLDGLAYPTGVMPWRRGVIISSAPEIFYAEDRDGDGKADFKVVLFTGFVEGNPQHRVNGFEMGLDGWIYGANGDSGGRIRSTKTGKTTSIEGRDFRFRPDTGEFEAESGRTQYGRHRDDWGRWFGNNNPNWGWHYVLFEQDLKRNPYYAAPEPRQDLEPETRCYPQSRTLARFNDLEMADHVTSANSPTPYRDELFGPWFSSSVFVSEPVHNLVHRIVLERDGVSFRGRRGPDEAKGEFLASSDNWFRPTMLKTGPDGALWIADMYRAVIEHPEWIPDDWEKRLDLRAGSEQGRIYRVYPVDKKPRRIPRLDRLDTTALVAALDSPSGWQRDTAQRLLLERAEQAAIGPLRDLVAGTRRGKTRVQAIWTLADLAALDEKSALAGLGDPDAAVRASTVAALGGLAGSRVPVAAALVRLADDADAPVRFQTALALGNWTDRRAGVALARLARRDGSDPWIRAALLSSAAPHVATLLAELFGSSGDSAAPPPELVEPLLALAGSIPASALHESLAPTLSRPAGRDGRFAIWQLAAATGLLEARRRARRPLETELEKSLAALWPQARGLVADDAAAEPERLASVRLLAHSALKSASDRELLLGMLRPQVPLALQHAAVAALGRGGDPTLAKRLVKDWKRLTPGVRGAILDALLARSAWTPALLGALEAGSVPAGEIDPARRQRLLARSDPAIRSRAEAIFAHQAAPRSAVVESYRSALKLNANPATGAAVYKKLCASCHRLGNDGVEVGPDLGTLNDKSPDALLIAILDPNRAFEAKYAGFSVATGDGRVWTGIITNESATAVTLLRQEGKEEALLRSDIQELASSGQSLMPEGMEKDLKLQDMADLISFLAGPSHARTRSEEVPAISERRKQQGSGRPNRNN